MSGPEQLSALLLGWRQPGRQDSAPLGFAVKGESRRDEEPVLLDGSPHLMTVARTGSGKTTGCIAPALLRHRGSVIDVDPDAERFAITARFRASLGQRVVLLDPFGLTGQATDTFNPLSVIDIRLAQAVDDVTTLISGMTAAVGDDPRNRYWQSRATHLLIGVTLMVLQRTADRRDREASLLEVRDAIGRAAANPEGLAREMMASTHPEVRRTAALLEIGARETLGGIVSFAQESCDFLRGDLLEASLARTTFDPSALTRDEPISLHLALPTQYLESHSRLLKLWLSALFLCVTRRRQLPLRSTLFILDEAAQLGTFPPLRQALTLLRGKGLQTWSLWQDLSQISNLYPADWRTLVNNCGALQFFGSATAHAAEQVAEVIGSEALLCRMTAADLVLARPGQLPQLLRRPDYRTDPCFAGLFDASPRHAAGPSRTAPMPPQRLLGAPEAPAAEPAQERTPPTPREAGGRRAPTEDALLRSLLGRRTGS